LVGSAVEGDNILSTKHDATAVGEGDRVHEAIIKKTITGDGDVEGEEGEIAIR
jgi:hypothetical protein